MRHLVVPKDSIVQHKQAMPPSFAKIDVFDKHTRHNLQGKPTTIVRQCRWRKSRPDSTCTPGQPVSSQSWSSMQHVVSTCLYIGCGFKSGAENASCRATLIVILGSVSSAMSPEGSHNYGSPEQMITRLRGSGPNSSYDPYSHHRKRHSHEASGLLRSYLHVQVDSKTIQDIIKAVTLHLKFTFTAPQSKAL
jgi:hypothetical protein